MPGDTRRRYPPELKEWATRMVAEIRAEHDSEWAAMTRVSELLGIGDGGYERLPGGGHLAARWRT